LQNVSQISILSVLTVTHLNAASNSSVNHFSLYVKNFKINLGGLGGISDSLIIEVQFKMNVVGIKQFSILILNNLRMFTTN